jgi:ABC-type phosphate/phosphonate transport system substrate-binding protein
VFVAVAVAMSGTAALPAGAEETPKEVRIGLPKPMFKDVPQALINAAAGPFQRMIQEHTGRKGVIELVPDYKELAARMKDGKIDIAVFHGFEYAWVKDMPELVPLVVTTPNCGKVQACLVVNKEANISHPKDLKGACVTIPKGTKAHCPAFLERLREEKKVPPGDCCPAKPCRLSIQEALFELGGGNLDAVLVDVSSLLALQGEYPGCFKALKVLAESPTLPSAVVVYRKGALDAQTIEKVRAGLINCVNTPAGSAFALFWQLKGFEDVSPRYNGLVETSLKALPAPASEPPTPRSVVTPTPGGGDDK